jgi:hypothetical protein
MSLNRVWIPSPNQSSRGGAGVRLVCIHTAEGALTYQSLGSYFGSASAQVSSHVGIDDTPGTVGEYVKPEAKAWTAAQYNPVAIQAELCAFAAWTTSDWDNHPTMLANTAQWIREECNRYGLPIVKLSASEAQGSGRGVCGHVELGSGGGGHWDPGPAFPWPDVLDMARGDSPAQPPTEEEIVAIATGVNSAGALHVFVERDDGSVWYTWQRKGDTAWEGGKKGQGTAELQPFAPAPGK